MASRSARFGILSRKNKTLYPNYVAYESDVRSIKAIQANARLQETGLPVFLRAKEIGKHVLFYVRGEHDLLGVFGQARTLNALSAPWHLVRQHAACLTSARE